MQWRFLYAITLGQHPSFLKHTYQIQLFFHSQRNHNNFKEIVTRIYHNMYKSKLDQTAIRRKYWAVFLRLEERPINSRKNIHCISKAQKEPNNDPKRTQLKPQKSQVFFRSWQKERIHQHTFFQNYHERDGFAKPPHTTLVTRFWNRDTMVGDRHKMLQWSS